MLATELQPGVTARMGSRCEAGSRRPGERHTAASDSPCFPDVRDAAAPGDDKDLVQPEVCTTCLTFHPWTTHLKIP